MYNMLSCGSVKRLVCCGVFSEIVDCIIIIAECDIGFRKTMLHYHVCTCMFVVVFLSVVIGLANAWVGMTLSFVL